MAYIGKTPTVAPLTSSDITDGIISNAKLAQDIISAETELATAPASTDEFLISDAGTLKRIDASLVGGGGITEADMYRLTANTSAGTNATITSNLERVDTAGFGHMGTGISESSGIFTFPSTGFYLINIYATIKADSGDTTGNLVLETTTNNSSYVNAAMAQGGNEGGGADVIVDGASAFIFDVTDTSTHKCRLKTDSMGNSFLVGDSNENTTCISFLRLGDT